MEWRPINSAPKDEQPVLVYEKMAFGPEPLGLATVAIFDASDGCWYPAIRSEIVLHPTHWRPLPDPPTE